jgi:hypothetical protein
MAVRHIDPPKSWNRVFKTDREVSGKELEGTGKEGQ